MAFGANRSIEEIPHYREQQNFAQETINFAHDNLLRRSLMQIPLVINSQVAPLEAREIAAGIIRGAQRSMGINLEFLQMANTPEQFANIAREFRREISLELDRLNQNPRDELRRNQIIESLSNWYLEQLQESVTRSAQRSYQMPLGERIIGRTSALNLGLGISLMEEQFGNRNAQRNFLLGVAERLENSEQIQDMLLGAQRSGFSSNAILEIGRNFDLLDGPNGKNQSFLVSQMIQNTLRYTATLINQNQGQNETNRQDGISQAQRILRASLGTAYMQRVLRTIDEGEDPTRIIVDRIESLSLRETNLQTLIPTRLS